MRPMLATYTDAVPAGEEWVHEVKWDGWRVIAEISGDRLRLLSRSGRDITAAFPELGGFTQTPGLLLDGELVAFDDSGRPSFHALARRTERGGRPRPGAGRVGVMLFDILRLDEHDLCDQPWHRRRELLEALGPVLAHDRWAIPDVHDDGNLLLEATLAQGLEGVVSKRRSAPYVPGARSTDWLKRPHRRRRSVVVVGWRPETGSRDRLGALLVAAPGEDGGLHYRGRVGSGLGGRAGDSLLDRLRERTAVSSPVPDVPAEDAAGVTWVDPNVIVDVESLGFADEERLRQPVFHGVRDDLSVDDILDGAPGNEDA